MRLVLDNSVAMRWLFADGSESDLSYANRVLDILGERGAQALAPSVWPLEVANMIARAEARGLLVESLSTRFLGLLDALGVVVDTDTSAHALGATLELARRYGLSAYDAAYLELALRESLPLATLDTALRQAADKAGLSAV